MELPLAGTGGLEKVLPQLIAVGSYTVRFRLAMVSDEVLNGVRSEHTIATCEVPIHVTDPQHPRSGQVVVNVMVTFGQRSCDGKATYARVFD